MKMVELGNLCQLQNGRAFKPSEWTADGRPIIRIQNLNDESKPFNYYNGKVDKKFHVFDGDLLFSWSGTPGTSFGAFFWYRGFAYLNQHIFLVKIEREDCNKNYLKYVLNSKLTEIIDQAHGGVGLKHITKRKLESLKLPLPPLPEQKRIAAILDQADALREKRRAAIAKLDELLQSVFLDMFGDPVTNPKGWDKKSLGNLITIRRGGSPRPIKNFLGGNFNWIKIGDATKGDNLYIEQCKDKIIREGLSKTVFLKAGSMVFANCGVSLGFARILKVDGCIHDGWLSFEDIPRDMLNEIFLLKSLNSITRYFRDTAPDGTQPNLNTTIMKNFKMILPPVSMQQRFSDFVLSVEEQRAMISDSRTQLDTLFHSLQQRAFRGEL